MAVSSASKLLLCASAVVPCISIFVYYYVLINEIKKMRPLDLRAQPGFQR
jgi:hypothetical protein